MRPETDARPLYEQIPKHTDGRRSPRISAARISAGWCGLHACFLRVFGIRTR